MKKILAALFVILAATYQLACNKSATPATAGSAAAISPSPVFSTFASGLPSDAPFGLTFDNGGNCYYTDSGYSSSRGVTAQGYVVMVNPAGSSTTVCGLAAPLWRVRDLAVDHGTYYLAVGAPGRIIKIVNGITTTLTTPTLKRDFGMTLRAGTLYFSSAFNGTVYSMSTLGGAISKVATGFSAPHGLVFDAAGNLYVADTRNGRIVKVSPGGVETNFATGLSKPWGLAIDDQGNIYVTERTNGKVDMFTPAGAKTILNTYNNPRGIWVTKDGKTVYVADSGDNAIHKITLPFWP